MKKIWYRKLWIWSVILLVIIITTGMITAPFWICNFNYNPNLSQSDLLAYFGAILSFLGTVFLGALALWQNHKLHRINMKILENEHRYGSIPQFEVSNVSVDYFNAFLPKDEPVFIDNNGIWQSEITTHYPEDNDCEISLIIDLKNIGDGLAKRLTAVYIDPSMKQLALGKIKKKDAAAFVENDYIRTLTKVNQTARFDYRLPLLLSDQDSDNDHITLEFTNLHDYKYVNFLYISYEYIEKYRYNVSVELKNYNDI